jgi:hypothetical protein
MNNKRKMKKKQNKTKQKYNSLIKHLFLHPLPHQDQISPEQNVTKVCDN